MPKYGTVSGLEYGENRSQKRSVASTPGAFADLGLVTLDDPHRTYGTAADFDGLRRVMQVGLQEYAEAHGHSVTRQPKQACENAENAEDAAQADAAMDWSRLD